MFKPMKVLALKDALELKVPKLSGNYFLTHKIDGWLTYIEYSKEEDTWYPPKSSAGRIIPAIAHMVDLFNKLPKPHSDCILIAEVDIPDTPFYITNGILNRTVGNYICENPRFSFHNIYFPDAPHTSYQTRYRCLQDLEEFFNKDFFKLLPILHIGEYSQKVWEHYFEAVINDGFEGLVAARENSLYLPGKRTADLLKLKLECTVDCLAESLEETVGNKGNPALVLTSTRSNGVKIRTVISNHAERARFLDDPTCIIGKVVEIKGMEEYEDGQIRQPVFKYIREDKLPTEID